MDLVIAESYLKMVLQGAIDDEDLNAAGIVIHELEVRFDYNLLDVYDILYKCPNILRNYSKMLKNISHLSSIFSLNDLEIKALFKKMPSFLLLDFDLLRYKLDLISATYGCSLKDSVKLLTQIPELINITKDFIIKQNNTFSKVLNQYGLKYRTILRNEPKLLFIDKTQIEECKKYLMKNFTLSEEECESVLVDSPTLIVSGVCELNKKFNFYYPKYFIKRDLKEILINSTTFLTLNELDVEKKICQLKEALLLSDKQVCCIIRQEPHILYFENVFARFNNFTKYNIGSSYVVSFPKLCLAPEISIPLKFVITRILGLDEFFNDICDMDINLLISRFMFMQNNSFFEHKDLILSEELFFNKYQISSKVLLLTYSIDLDVIKNICKYYIESKNSIKNWTDIIFPEFEDVLEYIYSGYSNRLLKLNRYFFKKTNDFQTNREYKINKILRSLQLSDQEIYYLNNKNKCLGKFLCSDIKKIIDELRKIGYSQEKIIKLLLKKQNLFNYNALDFCELIEQISKEENCSVSNVIENYL